MKKSTKRAKRVSTKKAPKAPAKLTARQKVALQQIKKFVEQGRLSEVLAQAIMNGNEATVKYLLIKYNPDENDVLKIVKTLPIVMPPKSKKTYILFLKFVLKKYGKEMPTGHRKIIELAVKYNIA
jgi:hypothetical protein